MGSRLAFALREFSRVFLRLASRCFSLFVGKMQEFSFFRGFLRSQNCSKNLTRKGQFSFLWNIFFAFRFCIARILALLSLALCKCSCFLKIDFQHPWYPYPYPQTNQSKNMAFRQRSRGWPSSTRPHISVWCLRMVAAGSCWPARRTHGSRCLTRWSWWPPSRSTDKPCWTRRCA